MSEHVDRALRVSLSGDGVTVSRFLLVASTCIFSIANAHEAPVGRSKVTSGDAKLRTLAEQQFFSKARPITFKGAKAGEGYLSPDGRWMVFQSERELSNPFYQIYLMDRDTGDSTRISPGRGKTTCAWIHPGKRKVLFSSTHLDPRANQKAEEERKLRSSPVRQKYSWSFDEHFDIFEVDVGDLIGPRERQGGRQTPFAPVQKRRLKRLTEAKGYDAEASYSPDGSQIAFASNRHAYTEALAPEQKKRFEQDASSMMDIYIMKSDGKGKAERLTSHYGYDGGPFFSSDGRLLTWRRFSPDGLSAEIMIMDLTTRKEWQITKMGAMSWAPFFHPSGDYLIFTSNKHGYENFELFVVDVYGRTDPIRVSELAGFDGLPVFGPSGYELLWTRRNERGESQIYQAEWNDTLVRQRLGLKSWVPTEWLAKHARVSDREVALKAWTGYFASGDLEGRATGSLAERKWTEAVAAYFSKLGLEPMSGSATYFHEFEFIEASRLIEDKNQLILEAAGTNKAHRLELKSEWVPLNFSDSGQFVSEGLVFAGYGLQAKQLSTGGSFDSYQGADVKDRWVVVLAGQPENVDLALRQQLSVVSDLRTKAVVAKAKGAKGLIVLSQSPLKFSEKGVGGVGIPVVQITQNSFQPMLKSLSDASRDWEARLNGGEKMSFSIPGLVQAQIGVETVKAKARSVVGFLKGRRPELHPIVIGAHGDHLGAGESSVSHTSLAGAQERMLPHFGADDNASGMATVLWLAKQAHKLRPERSVVFALWSGEELGVLGSKAWVESQPKDRKFLAYLNFDMVGRLREQKLIVQGVGSSSEWGRLFEKTNAKGHLVLAPSSDSFLPTDAVSFMLKSVPTASFFTGAHSEYHTPRDRFESLNFEGLAQINEFGERLLAALSHSAVDLPFSQSAREVHSGTGSGGARQFRLYLGTIPDYSAGGEKGVKISGAAKGSPADRAGLKAGDVIRSLGPITIDSIYDYVYALGALKPGEEVSMLVQRQGRSLQMKVTPQLKE